jgi:hypothetical protein
MASRLTGFGLAVALVFAGVGLSACTRPSAGGGGTAPPRADSADQVYGYLVTRSFHGGSGGLVLDEGRSYAFDVDAGVQQGTTTPAELRALAEAMTNAHFFELPPRLHNNDITDGNEVELIGVVGNRSHRSVNYMDRSTDYAKALSAVGKLVPMPQDSAHGEPPQALYSSLGAYLERAPSSPKTVAIRHWLDSAKALLGTNPAFNVPPSSSAASGR